jgi:hypothetical protein
VIALRRSGYGDKICVRILSLGFPLSPISLIIFASMNQCSPRTTIDPFQMAMQSGRDGPAMVELASRLNHNLNALRAVKDVSLPVQVVPHHAQLEDAIDIFDRINSQGTKLTDAELALTHVTAKWPLARRVLKEKMEFCEARDFDFNLTFMTRALVATVTGRALFELIHPRTLPELQAGWKALHKVLDSLMTVLPKAAHINSTEDLNTTNALIPLIAYLARNKGLVSFGGEGNVLVSPKLSEAARAALGVDRVPQLRGLRDSHQKNLPAHRALHDFEEYC